MVCIITGILKLFISQASMFAVVTNNTGFLINSSTCIHVHVPQPPMMPMSYLSAKVYLLRTGLRVKWLFKQHCWQVSSRKQYVAHT